MSSAMGADFFIVPPGPGRGWWELREDGSLHCSRCGARGNAAGLAVCPGCGASMAIDEPWTRRILERSYGRGRRDRQP